MKTVTITLKNHGKRSAQWLGLYIWGLATPDAGAADGQHTRIFTRAARLLKFWHGWSVGGVTNHLRRELLPFVEAETEPFFGEVSMPDVSYTFAQAVRASYQRAEKMRLKKLNPPLTLKLKRRGAISITA